MKNYIFKVTFTLCVAVVAGLCYACGIESRGGNNNSQYAETDAADTIVLEHKHKQVYQRFRDYPEYGRISVNIDWPVKYKDVDMTVLHHKLIRKAFERWGTDVRSMIKSYCAPRQGGKIVEDIPRKIKHDGYPLFVDELQIKCTQVAGRYATFRIEQWTQSALHSDPGQRQYVTYDLHRKRIMETQDIFNGDKSDELNKMICRYLSVKAQGDISEYVYNGTPRIMSFYLAENKTCFLFNDSVEGFVEIEIPNNEITDFMTEYGKQLLGFSNLPATEDDVVETTNDALANVKIWEITITCTTTYDIPTTPEEAKKVEPTEDAEIWTEYNKEEKLWYVRGPAEVDFCRITVSDPKRVRQLNQLMMDPEYRYYRDDVTIRGKMACARWPEGNRGGGIIEDFPEDITEYLLHLADAY